MSNFARGEKHILDKLYALKEKISPYVTKCMPYARVVIGVATLIVLVVLAFKSLSHTSVNAEVTAKTKKVLGARTIVKQYSYESIHGIDIPLSSPNQEDIQAAQVNYQEKLARIEEERKRQEEAARQEKLAKIEPLRQYLVRMKSPMADYSELIYDSCIQYGEHYCKYFLAISAVESGYGVMPIGCCQAWGMIYVRYPSWEVAIPRASNYIAQHYFLQGYDTFEKLATTSYHGGTDEAKEIWVEHLYMYYNQIPL